MKEKTFEEEFHLTDEQEIPCDYECPRCGRGVIHKITDISKLSNFSGDEMHWYICRKCECSWFPNNIKEWNERPKEDKKRIIYLRNAFKVFDETTKNEVLDELDSMGASYEI